MAAAKFYGTGRRKKSIARVFMAPGKGEIKVNGRTLDEFFGLDTLKMIVKQPLEATGNEGKFDIMVTVRGGGMSGQAGAIRHGISRALIEADADNRAGPSFRSLCQAAHEHMSPHLQAPSRPCCGDARSRAPTCFRALH